MRSGVPPSAAAGRGRAGAPRPARQRRAARAARAPTTQPAAGNGARQDADSRATHVHAGVTLPQVGTTLVGYRRYPNMVPWCDRVSATTKRLSGKP